jgi:hypothetical protein
MKTQVRKKIHFVTHGGVKLFLDKLTVCQLVTKLTAVYKARQYIAMLEQPAAGPYTASHRFSSHTSIFNSNSI